jgi:hypothetical protein
MSGNGIESLSGVPRSLGCVSRLRDACRASNNLEKTSRADDFFAGVRLGLTQGSCSEVGVMIGSKSRMASKQVVLHYQQRYLIERLGAGDVDRYC